MIRTVHRTELATEYYTSEGCYIIEISNTADDPQASIARARVTPGTTTRWHRVHGTTERYYILQGVGRVEVGNRPPCEVVPGDVVLIPASERQRITSCGTLDLIFLAICTPRFRPQAYEELDPTP